MSPDGESWDKYIAFSGLTRLTEVVSLDGLLCPSLLPEIKDDYWPHIVNEDFMLQYFVCFRQGCVAPVPERHNSETVAPRHPVMPVANGLGSGFVGINGKQLRERNSHFPPVPADLHEHVVLARTLNGHA